MAVVKQAYASAIAPWTITSVCDDVRDAFIGAGLMTAWFDSFTAGGYEHRILQVTYDAGKTYGKTYYWFTFNGVGIWLRIVTGWNATTHVPTGTQYVDYYDANTSAVTAASQLITISTSISFSVTRYTSSGRSFFTLRTGSTYHTFTIDPAGTTFRSFYDLNIGYHEGWFTVSTGSGQVTFSNRVRYRRALLLGSSINNSTSSIGTVYTPIVVSTYSLPRNAGNSPFENPPTGGFVLPGWTTSANPSASSNFNPVFTGLRLSSVHTSDLPADFGITAIKVSNTLAIQDNATVTAGSEEYEILHFTNDGFSSGIANNPVFLVRII
jgi:hypothetical protein